VYYAYILNLNFLVLIPDRVWLSLSDFTFDVFKEFLLCHQNFSVLMCDCFINAFLSDLIYLFASKFRISNINCKIQSSEIL
jgi:hypothetical protein